MVLPRTENREFASGKVKHPFLSFILTFFQASSKFGDQKVRRENRLKELKEKRDQAKATARKLSNEETCNRPEGKVMMEFKGALMQSEWLIDTPENFEDWVVKVCPIGRRRLLHASYGETCLYNGRGQRTHK